MPSSIFVHFLMLHVFDLCNNTSNLPLCGLFSGVNCKLLDAYTYFL